MTQNDTDKNPSSPQPLSYAEERAQRERDYKARIEADKADMAILLAAPAEDEGALESVLARQGHALDRLFTRTMMDSTQASSQTDALLLAMRMQRECRETIQALARVRRTNSLTERTDAINNARNPGKQTDSDKRLYNAEGRLIYDFTAMDD